MNKLNQKIIDAQEKYHHYNKVGLFAYFHSFIILIISISIVFLSESFNPVAYVFSIGCLCLFIDVFPETTVAREDFRLIDLFFYHLHYYLPNKNQRTNEISAFIASTPNVYTRNNPLIKLILAEKFKNINLLNIHSWIKENVSSEKAIISLIIERALGTKEIRMGILFWSQLIPKNISSDSFRKILMSSQIVDGSDLSNCTDISQSKIQEAFKSYSESDLVRIFTSPYRLKQYVSILNFLSVTNITLPLKKDMTSLSDWCLEMETSLMGEEFNFDRSPDWINKLEKTENPLGQITLIDNVASLEYWAETMRNCIKTKKEDLVKKKIYLFGIIKNHEPYIVFEVSSSFCLAEVKRKANVHLNSNEFKQLEAILKTVKNS